MQRQVGACGVIAACSGETKRERIFVCTWGVPDACKIWGGNKEGVETVHRDRSGSQHSKLFTVLQKSCIRAFSDLG